MTTLPFVTKYDPRSSSEGSLDPLGLYQIADQLAVKLVPAVRERMQRVRFLTAIAVGAVVTDGLEPHPRHAETPPFMVWEWLVVEAIVRTMPDSKQIRGVPGTLVTRRALAEYGYVDRRSYLKTARVFGFHGVYKRLAVHLGLVDVHLGPRSPNGDDLVQAWRKGMGGGEFGPQHPLCRKWRSAVERCLRDSPPRTRPHWQRADWAELANFMAPHKVRSREKRCLRRQLLGAEAAPLGALPAIWRLQETFADDEAYADDGLHRRLAAEAPEFGMLLKAIEAYEAFARALQDSFDLLRRHAGQRDAAGFDIREMAKNKEFLQRAGKVADLFENAHQALGEIGLAEQGLFQQRFDGFGQPMSAADLAVSLCEHHEGVQKRKSAEGKRPWFDRLGPDRIFMRHRYRVDAEEGPSGSYVHEYRGWPIRRFYEDLS